MYSPPKSFCTRLNPAEQNYFVSTVCFSLSNCQWLVKGSSQNITISLYFQQLYCSAFCLPHQPPTTNTNKTLILKHLAESIWKKQSIILKLNTSIKFSKFLFQHNRIHIFYHSFCLPVQELKKMR